MRTALKLLALLVLSAGAAGAADSSASIYYFSQDYNITSDLSAAVERIIASSSSIKLAKTSTGATYTNGRKFVIEGPDKLSSGDLNRTTDYTLESSVEIIEGGHSLMMLPAGRFELFAGMIADNMRGYFSVERLPAEILAGTSPSGLKFRALNVPSRREQRLWEPTVKVVYRTQLGGAEAVFTDLPVPMGLNGLPRTVIKEASRKETNALLSLGVGGNLQTEVPTFGPEHILNYLTEAGADIAALDPNDLENFWRWSREGGLKLSSSAPEFVCSNVTVSDPELARIIKPYALRELAGVKTAFIALVPSNSAILAGLSGSPFNITDPKDEKSFYKLITELREKQKAKAVVAVSFLRREEIGWLVGARGVDVLIGPPTWDNIASRNIRAELTGWKKEFHIGPALTVSPDTRGGRIKLDFREDGELAAVEALPHTEDGSEPFYYREQLAIKERIIKHFLGPQDSLLPDPRKIFPDRKTSSPVYEIPDFFNMAANLLRKRAGAEISVLKINPFSSNVPGDTPSAMVKTWLGPEERVELAWITGNFIRNFFLKQMPAYGPDTYYSPETYIGHEHYAVSGLDRNGRVGGLPLSDTELYLTAIPESLLAGIAGYKPHESRKMTTHEIVIGELRKIKNNAPARADWEARITEEVRNIAEERKIWRLNLRSLSLQLVNTGVTGAPGYAGVNESRLSAVNQTNMQGSCRLFSEFYAGKLSLVSGVSADYGKLTLRPRGQPHVTSKSADQLILESELRYRLKSYSGALGPLVIGPFASAAYDTEFSRTEPLPLRQVLRGRAGLKMFEGAYLQEFYAGLTTEQVYTYSPARTQYAAETGFRLALPLPGTALMLSADGNYRNFARSRFDTVYDLKERLELNLKVSTRLYGDITISPFFNYFLASGKKLPGSAANLTTGFALEYSRLFKLKR